MVGQWLEERIPQQYRSLRRRVRRLLSPAWLGTLRRVTPLSAGWGFDRGEPLDRYYIERFLAEWRADIRGQVLEVKNSTYTDRYGQDVEQRAVLDIDAGNPQATHIADLAASPSMAAAQFDCLIITQTLHFIYDVQSAVRQIHHILRPGGVALVTVPALSRVTQGKAQEVDYWRFTPAGCAKLFGAVFGTEQVTVQAYGNVLTCMGFLTGMAREELTERELTTADSNFPLLVAVRAVKQRSVSMLSGEQSGVRERLLRGGLLK